MELLYNSIRLFILITQISLILAGENTVSLNKGDVGQDIYNMLFIVGDRIYTPWTPNEVLENLRKLVTIYDSNSFKTEQAYSVENRSLVRGLMDTMTEQSCTKENIIKYNDYMKSLSIYGNIIRALKLYRDEHFKKCEPQYPQPLFASVNAMSYEDRAAIMRLHGEILNHLRLFNMDLPFYTGEAFNKGVLYYLSKNPGAFREKWKKEKVLPKSDLASLYDEQIISLCSRLGENFYKEADFFLKIVATDTILAQINKGPARHWMISAYICQDASKRRQEVIDDVHSLMNSYAHPKRRSLFKWIRDENQAARYLRYR